MMLTNLLLGLASLLGPQGPGPNALDVVELKNGDVLEGRIVTQLDAYVEIELGAGATVGLSRAQIARIARGAGATVQPARGPIAPRSEWFVIHDASGEAVGWLQAGISVAADGAVLVSEEYEFSAGSRRYQITSQVRASATLEPLGCYFRERIGEPVVAAALVPNQPTGRNERVVEERILEGRCDGDQLVLSRLDRNGRSERRLPWPAGATFPLLARLQALHEHRSVPVTTMYDPLHDELLTRGLEAPKVRAVRWDGEPQKVTELVDDAAGAQRNAAWYDQRGGTLRRELAGPSLVAVRSAAESAPRAASGSRIASSFVVAGGDTFACWLPNPSWVPIDDLPEGRLVLQGPHPGTSIAVTRLDHLEPGTALTTAADAVANWFLLLHPELRFESRQSSSHKGRDTLRLVAQGRDLRATVDVLPHGEAFVVVSCVAPRAVWSELVGDFEFAVRTLELDAAAIAPRLQGPVQRRAEAAEASAGRRAVGRPTAGEPTGSPSRARAGKLPLVRVPTAH